MEHLLIPFLVSFLITILATPLTIKFAKAYGLVDDPKLRPHPAHIQERVIPRAAGLPVFIAIICSILLFINFDKHILGIILGLTVLLTMGLLDDYLKNFKPLPRLLLQFLAAFVVVASGIGISFITNPLGGVIRLDNIVYQINFLGEHNIILIADIFAFLWIVWMMNMINWSKGVDGQMPGITLIASLTIAIVSLKLFYQSDSNQLDISKLAIITTGTSLGLLIFNWYPSKILPGFSGSNILAFMIAVLSILSGAKLATALLVLLIPTIDFFYTFFRRVLSGQHPMQGDQKHLHHLLLKRGWSHPAISLFYIASCAILGLLAISLNSEGKLFIALVVGVIFLGTLLWLHLLSKTPEEN